MPGTRLGPYEIAAPIGAGGMGEVYRALDTHLSRQVAIKILPDTFAHDPERLARFEREAKTLAALNHPHIAQIYGFEKSDGIRALAMELVEGPTLADQIARGPIPLDEALPIAKQIAEALEAAHEQGIIHRDLKPANIKVRPDGTVKVLDFGLAKAMEPAGALSPGVTQSPTITSPAMMTGVGVLLGTAAYMSPEQARGKPVDKRTDIWAFGCVLYEMLAGARAFPGDDVTETLAAVVKLEPHWDALPAPTPPSLRRFLRRCLTKDPKNRLQLTGRTADPNSVRIAVRCQRLRATTEQLADALGACAELHAVHRRLLRLTLDELRLIEDQIEQLDEELARLLRTHQDVVERLAAVPGLGVDSAQQIIAEVGPTAATFPSGKRLASWVGACPGHDESAGINHSRRSPNGNRQMRRLLNQAAHAAVKTKGSIFELVYRRLVVRLGHAQSIGAIAHRLCRLVWKILNDRVIYEERGPAVTKERAQRRAAKMIRELRSLGYRIEPLSPSESRA